MGFHGAITGAMMIPQMWTRTLRTVALAATLLMALPGSGRAHMSDECFVHVVQMQERADDHAEFLGETSRLLRTYEGESVAALASGSLERMMGGFSRFMFSQLPVIFKQFTDAQKSSNRVIESAVAAIGCTVNEPKPVITVAPVAPVDLEWLDGVLETLDEQPPAPVELGVDCAEPFHGQPSR